MSTRDEMTHDFVAELLPWLANDSLAADEKARVLEHAQSCVVCRKELTELEDLRDTVAAALDESVAPPADMRRINRRIDKYMETRRRFPRALEAIGSLFRSPLQAIVVLQAFVIIGLLAALLGQNDDPRQYTTLTTDIELPPGNYLRLVVATTPDAGDLTGVLARHALTIVDGPSDRGVATVAFPASTGPEERGEVMRMLAEEPMMRYVQPLTVPAP